MKHLLTLLCAMLAVSGMGQQTTDVTILVWTNYVPLNIKGSNCWYSLTNWSERIPVADQDQAVRDLAKAGIICKALGHFWEAVSYSMVYVTYPIQTEATRTCHICGKVETKTEEWK